MITDEQLTKLETEIYNKVESNRRIYQNADPMSDEHETAFSRFIHYAAQLSILQEIR